MGGVKQHSLPEPYQIRRPGEKPKKRKSFRQMARAMMGGEQ